MSRHAMLEFTIHGVVTGVHFRKFVVAQAQLRRLTGWVDNDHPAVVGEATGERAQLEAFVQSLKEDLGNEIPYPKKANVTTIDAHFRDPTSAELEMTDFGQIEDHVSLHSPVKKGGNQPLTRPARSKYLKGLNHVRELPDFATRHLAYPPSGVNAFTLTEEQYIPAIRHSKEELYDPIKAVLNGISERLHQYLQSINHFSARLVFIDHHSRAPAHHPSSMRPTGKQRPDLLAVTDSDALLWEAATKEAVKKEDTPAFPWHRVKSTVESKGPNGDDPLYQGVVYAGSLNQSRPDVPGVYALTVENEGYRILWSDPTGAYASPRYSWDTIGHLVGYVYSLYDPPLNHGSDPTITLAPDTNIKDKPTWIVHVDSASYKCQPIFVSEPWGRMTWVARCVDGGVPSSILVIKYYYHSSHRRFKELDLIEQAQEGGAVSGVVQVYKEKNPYRTVGMPNEVLLGGVIASPKTRIRILLETDGDDLMKCSSVLEFLLVMYDLLEVHKFLVKERGVLHRDLSIQNVLCHPRSRAEAQVTDNQVLHFISKIIDPNNRNVAKCLLIDFDNAASLRQLSDDENRNELHARTGTPMFIARSVAQRQVLDVKPSYEPFPGLKLGTPVRIAYDRVHGPTKHDEYKETRSGAFVYDESIDKPAAVHLPRHDAESVFWIIVYFLLLALPAGADVRLDETEKLSATFNKLRHHVIDDDQENDPRSSLLTMNVSRWKGALHADLVHMASFIRKLAVQVSPEYYYLERGNQLLIDHLHEAMQRVILEQIFGMLNDPIPLSQTKRQPTDVPIVGYGNSPFVIHHRLSCSHSMHSRSSDFNAGNSAGAASLHRSLPETEASDSGHRSKRIRIN